ncbi:MAG: ribonuclease P protein component [Candidatus Dojkabacteria bacterium]|nr:ribonuclease P protein component [Candidatus Dojkabacteria bacterium]MDD2270298.1 ribonuclease P protein component [Candidatus Dojkabacteria bacterium]
MLQKRYRLPPKLFKYIYEKGDKYRDEYGMLIAVPYSTEITPKFGFVVSKKIGNAPQRHRMTRLLRVVVKESVEEMRLNDNGYIYEYIAFKFCNDFHALKESFQKLLKKSMKNEKNSALDN